MLNDIELLELLCAKFCHDLAGPIGAINNGLDFCEDEDPIMRNKAVSLVKDSSDQCVARIQFFRYLYGTVQEIGEANLNDVRNLVENFFRKTKIIIDWPNDNLFVQGLSINNRIGKLILATIMSGASMLISSGTISIRLNKIEQNLQIKIVVSDPTIKKNQKHFDIILDKEIVKSDITNKNIYFYLVKRFSNIINATTDIEQKETEVTFSIIN